MKVIESRLKTIAEPRPRATVTDIAKEKLDTVDLLERVDRPEPVEVPAAPTPPEPERAPEPVRTPTPARVAVPSRLIALDAFRGLTVLLMLIVNNVALEGLTPDSLTHAPWNQGLRLADYVFPWFLLCVGLAIPFSFASFKQTGLASWRYDIKILSRAASLFLIGCLVNAAVAKQVTFGLGVLQLVAMAYLIAAYAYELPMVRRAIIGTLMLIGYGMAIRFLPVPGSPVGTFTEDTNFIDHINRTYLMMYNMDGLFSAIPTAAIIIYASLVGDALRNPKLDHLRRIIVMLGVGALMAGIGFGLSFVIPYNKPVWTPSYVLFTGGIGFIVLAGFYLLTDAVSLKKWPFVLVVLGANPILAYILPVFAKVMVFTVWTVNTPKGNIPLQQALLETLVNSMGKVPGAWTYTWVYISCWWLILLILFRKKMFLRV